MSFSQKFEVPFILQEKFEVWTIITILLQTSGSIYLQTESQFLITRNLFLVWKSSFSRPQLYEPSFVRKKTDRIRDTKTPTTYKNYEASISLSLSSFLHYASIYFLRWNENLRVLQEWLWELFASATEGEGMLGEADETVRSWMWMTTVTNFQRSSLPGLEVLSVAPKQTNNATRSFELSTRDWRVFLVPMCMVSVSIDVLKKSTVLVSWRENKRAWKCFEDVPSLTAKERNTSVYE